MYFYEHVNGKIISKPDIVVDVDGPGEYFNSAFVNNWWHEDGSHTTPMNTEIDKEGGKFIYGKERWRD